MGEFGDDLFFGDNGVALFNLEPTNPEDRDGEDGDPSQPGDLISVLREIASLAPEIGGNDVILTREGDDTGIAGEGDDLVNYVPVGSVASDPEVNATGEPSQIGEDTGVDIVIGDNGMGLFDTRTGVQLLHKIRSFEPTIGGVVLDPVLRAQIEQALEDQQAGIIEPYAFHDHQRPGPASLDVTGTFGIDEFIADDNNRLVDDSAAAVIPGALDASLPPE